MERGSGLSGRAKHNHSSHYQTEAEALGSERNARTEAEVEQERRRHAADFEGGERGPMSSSVGDPQTRDKRADAPQLCRELDFRPERPTLGLDSTEP